MHAIGTLVTIPDARFPGTWRVDRNGPKNAVVMPANPDGTARPGRGVRVPHAMLSPGTADVGAPTGGVPYVAATPLHPGTLVRSTVVPDGLYVVIADKGDRVNLAKLGGDSGRYYRAPRATVTTVPVPAALAA